jgi:hypothetical protein
MGRRGECADWRARNTNERSEIMCPICLTTAAALAAGTGATTGLAAWLLGRRGARRKVATPNRRPREV